MIIMGYTTVFEGQFNLNKKLDTETHEFLNKLASTRRMKRNVDESVYGIEGELYVDGEGFKGQDREDNVIDSNSPPWTQPGLWLDWTPTEDGTAIEWNRNEKFYDADDWIIYLIEKVLKPKGYVLNGVVNAEGEDGYQYHIFIKDNKVIVSAGLSKKHYAPDWKKWHDEMWG